MKEAYQGDELALGPSFSGKGSYGIVQEPCVVHLPAWSDVLMYIWREGGDWHDVKQPWEHTNFDYASANIVDLESQLH